MNYFTDVLATFLCVDRVISLLSMESQRALTFSSKYLNLCSKMNGGLTGLERHEGE